MSNEAHQNAATMASANVATAHGESYLKRLCRHFAHKVPVTHTDTQGRIELPFGFCRIDVDALGMYICVEVADAADLDRAQAVIADHLIRMANRDTPVVQWQRQSAGG